MDQTKRCDACQAIIGIALRVCPSCGADVGGALAHLRVLDLTGPGTQYCGRLMADAGADVVKIEPAGGDPARRLKPYAGDRPDLERSLTFLAFNLNKRSAVLDLTRADDQARFRALAASADALIEDGSSWDLPALGLGYDALAQVNPGLVYTSVTPFGRTGPYASFLGDELVLQALGGMFHSVGDPDMRPVMAPLRQGYQLAAQHAAFATLAALRYRDRTGRGQHVEIVVQEVIASILINLGRYANAGEIGRRPGASTNMGPTNTYVCKDGLIYMQPGYPRHIEALYEWMGNPVLQDEVWKDREFRRANSDVLTALVSEFTAQFTKMEFAAEAQRRHIPTAPLMTIEDLVRDEHLRARRYFVSVDHPVVGSYDAPGPPFRMGASPLRVYRPAPRLGEHTAQVLDEWTSARSPVNAGHGEGPVETPAQALKGLRILDFSRVWAGPYGTRYLAELGADVIKVESRMLPDRDQVAGAFAHNFGEIQRSKRSITLNMVHPKALPLAEKLLTVCDVVIENFRPGVLEEWGLGYERMKEVRPDIIYLSMPGFGMSGPRADNLSYGQSLLAYTGLMDLWAHPESPGPTRPKVALPDFIAAATGCFALLAALAYRERTGKGQLIELAQVEGLVSTMGVAFLDYALNGRLWKPSGNSDPNAAPHDVFPCRGDDAWCAIACSTQEQWQALCNVLGSPPWASDPRFATLEGRQQHAADLYACISAWTRERTPRQVMLLLQRAGVPAGVVATGEDLYYDVNLRAREFIVKVDHRPVLDVLEHPGFTVQMSETPSRIGGPVPRLGEHNYEVFGGLLGLSNAEIEQLMAEQVIY